MTSALRSFLQYARYRGDVTLDLAAAVPVVANWSMPSIPRAMAADQGRQLLASTDRRTAIVRRDYAIRLLRARLGLRSSEVLTVPRSPCQNLLVESLISSARRECLDHVIVLGEQHLRRLLASYFEYYHGSRTHLSLGKDAPDKREVESPHPGTVVALPKVGGWHHHYTRWAA
jgi:site-specific recombinase XerC